MTMTGSIMSGAGGTSGGLDAIFKLMAEDPAGFQAKITAFTEAETRAREAIALAGKAEEIPALHEAAKAASEEATRELMTAQVEARQVCDEAQKEAAAIVKNAEDILAETLKKRAAIEEEISLASEKLSKLRQAITRERADADAAIAMARANLDAATRDLDGQKAEVEAAEKAAAELMAKLDDKAARINAIILE